MPPLFPIANALPVQQTDERPFLSAQKLEPKHITWHIQSLSSVKSDVPVNRTRLLSYTPSKYSLYPLLAQRLAPSEETKDYLKLALEPYTTSSVSQNGEERQFLKIIGIPAEELIEKEQSTYSYKNNKTFPLAASSADLLCEIIRESPQIDQLMLVSNQGKKPSPSFGDDVAEVLASGLPKKRFSTLVVSGSFGNTGASILLDAIPTLLKKPKEECTVFVYGEQITHSRLIQRANQLKNSSALSPKKQKLTP
jgi:hypothetical protein